MNVSQNISQRIRILSLLAMLSVIIIHSENVNVLSSPKTWNVCLQIFLTNALTSWAVPMFFMISGFLFGKTENFMYSRMLKKKFFSLFIPFVAWGLIGYVFYLSYSLIFNYFANRSMFANTMLMSDSFFKSLNAIFGFFQYEYIKNDLVAPIGNRPLWYIRTLIFLFIFSPFFIWLKNLSFRFIFYLGLTLVIIFPNVCIPFVSLKCYAIGYFMIGMTVNKVLKRQINSRFVLFSLLVLSIFICLYKSLEFVGILEHYAIMSFYVNILPLLLSACLFIISNILRNSYLKNIPFWFPFWTYCFHGIFMYYFHGMYVFILSAIFLEVLGDSSCVSILLLLLTPLTILILSYICGSCFLRFFPRLFLILCGWRV